MWCCTLSGFADLVEGLLLRRIHMVKFTFEKRNGLKAWRAFLICVTIRQRVRKTENGDCRRIM